MNDAEDAPVSVRSRQNFVYLSQGDRQITRLTLAAAERLLELLGEALEEALGNHIQELEHKVAAKRIDLATSEAALEAARDRALKERG